MSALRISTTSLTASGDAHLPPVERSEGVPEPDAELPHDPLQIREFLLALILGLRSAKQSHSLLGRWSQPGDAERAFLVARMEMARSDS